MSGTGAGSKLPSLAIWSMVEPSEERDLEEARHARVQDAEAVLAALHFEERLVGEVHRHLVAEETVEIEDVHGELAMSIPGLVREHQVDIVFEITERLERPARQPQVHAVVDSLVAAIEGRCRC